MPDKTGTPKPKKVSNSLLEQIGDSLSLSTEQVQKLRDDGIAVGGTRRNTARFFMIGDTKVTPSFSFKGSSGEKLLPEMNELRSEVDELIDKYTDLSKST